MRIAMLGHKRIPSREGGIEVVVGELGSRMVKAGHSVTCYNRAGRVPADAKAYKGKKYNGIKLKKVFTINGRGLAAASSSFFACIAAGFGRYDVVHIHAEGPAFWSFIPKKLGKKVIVTVHGLDWNRSKWSGFAAWYIKKGEKRAVKYADEIIVLSENMKNYFLKEYVRETIYIPNGVTRPTRREADIIKKYGLEKDNYVLYLGRIVPEKGEHYLVEAWKRLKTGKKLVIAGGISDTAEYDMKLKKIAADDDRIIFTGFVSGETLDELYSNAYIYCLPSDIEGMPISLLEAMSYGCCCLTSNIPECVEMLGGKAITFSKGSIDDLKNKLGWLIKHPEIVEKFKMGASDFICSKYNWDDVAAQTLKVYEK